MVHAPTSKEIQSPCSSRNVAGTTTCSVRHVVRNAFQAQVLALPLRCGYGGAHLVPICIYVCPRWPYLKNILILRIAEYIETGTEDWKLPE